MSCHTVPGKANGNAATDCTDSTEAAPDLGGTSSIHHSCNNNSILMTCCMMLPWASVQVPTFVSPSVISFLSSREWKVEHWAILSGMPLCPCHQSPHRHMCTHRHVRVRTHAHTNTHTNTYSHTQRAYVLIGARKLESNYLEWNTAGNRIVIFLKGTAGCTFAVLLMSF